MANVSFLAGSTRDLNNYLLGNGQLQGITDYFNREQQYIINTGMYNPYQPGTVEYNNIQALNDKVMTNVTEAINYSYNPNNIIGDTQEMLAQITTYDRDALVTDTTNFRSYEDVPKISYTTQTFVIADPKISEAINKGMLHGYENNLCERSDIKGVDIEHTPEYMDSVNGMAMEGEDGEMYSDTYTYGASNKMYDNRFELSMYQQEAIKDMRRCILMYKTKGIDLTKQ